MPSGGGGATQAAGACNSNRWVVQEEITSHTGAATPDIPDISRRPPLTWAVLADLGRPRHPLSPQMSRAGAGAGIPRCPR